MPRQTAGEQERLRATLIQGETKKVQVFLDRVESIQYILDLDLPDTFWLEEDTKDSYRMVHRGQVRANFVAGLKAEIRKHVVSLANVVTLDDVLNAAIAYEKANAPLAAPKVAGASGGPEDDLTAQIAALEFRRQQLSGGGSLKDEGCFYCGWVGHIKPDCRTKKNDEARGIFQNRATGYVKGRVGRGRGGGRGGQGRGGQGQQRGGQRGGGAYRGRGGYANSAGDAQQAQQQPPQQQQQPPVVQFYQNPGFVPYQSQQQPVVQMPGSQSTSSTPEMRGFFNVPSPNPPTNFGTYGRGSEN